MKLIDIATNQTLEAVVKQLVREDVIKLKNNKQFTFKWNLERDNDVYTIKLMDKKEILGLISIIDYPRELRIHINLIESSKKFRGKNKPLNNIPGCLIAFVCQLAFKKGYEGFVSLVPKTTLVKYYQQTYGFQLIGNQMAVYNELSNSIIEKYLGHETI